MLRRKPSQVIPALEKAIAEVYKNHYLEDENAFE
jgi:hypothetical protein